MELQRRIAKIHAQYVLRYVENLNCPMSQKLQLIDAVAETCRQRAEEEKQKQTGTVQKGKKVHSQQER